MKTESDLVSVPLSNLMHDDSKAYLLEKYGARPIEEWPFYGFIQDYLAGNAHDARDRWVEWLVVQFGRYMYWRKKHGGMLGGSVHRFAQEFASCENECLSDPGMISPEHVQKGAGMLVDRRLILVDSIFSDGYRPELGDRVVGVRRGRGGVMLKGGHHRAATLKALGYQELPGVEVASPFCFKARYYRKKLGI